MNIVWDPGLQWCVNSYLLNLFICQSIAYTLVLHRYYYDVKYEVLADNSKHTSVLHMANSKNTSILHLHYINVLATMLLEWEEIVFRSGYKVIFQVESPTTGYTLYGSLR